MTSKVHERYYKSPFYTQRKDLDKELNLLREEYTALLYQDPRYPDILNRRRAVQEECAKVGHKRGRHWDNGLGVEWYYCIYCDAVFDFEEYHPLDDDVEVVNED